DMVDGVVGRGGAWWRRVVGAGSGSKRAILRAACIGVVVCALLFGARMRVLAIPIELLLLVVAFRAGRAAMKAGGDADQRIRAACAGVFGDNVAARVVAT